MLRVVLYPFNWNILWVLPRQITLKVINNIHFFLQLQQKQFVFSQLKVAKYFLFRAITIIYFVYFIIFGVLIYFQS